MSAEPMKRGRITKFKLNRTNLPKTDWHVFDAMSESIAKDLGKKGPGIFVVPGLLKLKVVDKPATKAKQGVNPFTGQPMTIRPASARKKPAGSKPEISLPLHRHRWASRRR